MARRRGGLRTAAAGPLTRLGRFEPRWILGCAIALVVVGSTALSAWWAARVPIFGAPDEDVHFDYVVSLVTAQRLLLASERPAAQITAVDPFVPIIHPYTRHLAAGSETRATRFRPEVKPPAGYGTEEFFAALDRTAPTLERPPARTPWAIKEYPVGYYAAAAAWAVVASSGSQGPVTLFFAARSFSVVLLGLGLVAWWGVLRQRGCPPLRALGLLAAVGFLPLTSFVSSYVQPDNLAFAAVPLCLWLAGCVVDRPPSAGLLGATGCALALLLLTKYHVFLCVALPVVALLAVVHARWPRRRWLAWSVLLFGPVALAAELQLWISSGGGAGLRNLGSGAIRARLLAEAGSLPVYLVNIMRAALEDFFGLDGTTFRTFWWLFGWLDTRVTIVSEPVHEVVGLALQVGMVVLLLLLAVRWGRIATSLVSLWRRGARWRVTRLLVSDPLLNSMLLYVSLLTGIYIYTGNGFLAQGRNWFAFLPSIFWAVAVYSPRALGPRHAARWLSRAVLAGLLLYASFGAWAGIQAVEERYYGAVHAAMHVLP